MDKMGRMDGCARGVSFEFEDIYGHGYYSINGVLGGCSALAYGYSEEL